MYVMVTSKERWRKLCPAPRHVGRVRQSALLRDLRARRARGTKTTAGDGNARFDALRLTCWRSWRTVTETQPTATFNAMRHTTSVSCNRSSDKHCWFETSNAANIWIKLVMGQAWLDRVDVRDKGAVHHGAHQLRRWPQAYRASCPVPINPKSATDEPCAMPPRNWASSRRTAATAVSAIPPSRSERGVMEWGIGPCRSVHPVSPCTPGVSPCAVTTAPAVCL